MPPAAAQLKNRLTFAQVISWDVESVCGWLVSIGIPEAQGHFRKEKLDGKSLIKLSPKDLVSKLHLKKQQKETLTLYFEDLNENMKISANTLKGSVHSTAPAQVVTSPGRSAAAEAATDDEFDDDEWADDDDEIYANELQPSSAIIADVPVIPDRNQQPGRQPLRSANQPPPPPIRSPTTRLGSSETTSDDEYVAPASVAPPVPSASSQSAMTSSRPAPPPPVDELYEAPDANDVQDDMYEATETYVENKQMPSQMAPGRPSQPHVPVLPPRGGPAVQQPRAKQSVPSHGPAVPTDDEVYEEPEPAPPTPKRSVPMAPTLDDVYQVTDSEVTPAALPDRRHQPVPPVPPPSSGITGRPVPPPPSTPAPKHSVPSPMSPGTGRPSAGRPVPPPPASASNDDEIYEETEDVVTVAPPPPPPGRGRLAPPPPAGDQPSDDICYEATDNYQENKLPANKTGCRPPALPPSAVRPPIPAPQDTNHDGSEDIYEETDDMKPPLPAGGPGRLPPVQPDKQRAAPVLPNRHVPVVPDEEVYEETDDLSEDYTVPDSVLPPPPPPPTRTIPESRTHSTSDDQCADFNHTTSSSSCPPRKPPPLPGAQIPVDDTTQGPRIPAGAAPFPKMVGDKTVKEMRGKLRPVINENGSRAAPGGPPCVDVEQQQAPGAPWAGQLKRRTSATNSAAASQPVPQPILPPVVNLKTVTPNPRTRPQPQPPSPVAIPAPDNERPSPKSSFKKTGDPLDKFSWYFGNIHRDIAKQKIADMKMEGAFMVRKSENGGPEFPFTLTVLHNSEVFNIQLRLRAEDSKFALGKPKPKETVHSTIEDLVRFHENNEIEVTKLSGPCGGVKLVSSPSK